MVWTLDGNLIPSVFEEEIDAAFAGLATVDDRIDGEISARAALDLKTEYAFSSYKVVAEPGVGVTGSAAAAGTYLYYSNGLILLGGANSGVCAYYLDPAWFSGGAGRTTKMKIVAFAITNAVAPGSNFVFGLHPITTFGGASGAQPTITAVGTRVPGSDATITTPGATQSLMVASADFNAPAAGFYALSVVTNAVIATNAFTYLRSKLLVRQV